MKRHLSFPDDTKLRRKKPFMIASPVLLISLFSSGNAILLYKYPASIPKRDMIACVIGLVVIIFASIAISSFSVQKHQGPTRDAGIIFTNDRNSSSTKDQKRFQFAFNVLSSAEVICTIVLPWLVILKYAIINDSACHDATPEDSAYAANKYSHTHNSPPYYLLASHLFVFQAQIVLECILIELIECDYKTQSLFIFTCLANLYRIMPLGTWIELVMSTKHTSLRSIGLMHMLPVFAILLWLYSSFIFIPFEWYPNIVWSCEKTKENPAGKKCKTKAP